MKCGYKLQQVSYFHMWPAGVFHHKTFYDRVVYFLKKKIPKANPLLNKEVSSQSAKNNSWF